MVVVPIIYLDLPKSDFPAFSWETAFSGKVIIFLPGGNFPEFCFLDVCNKLAEAFFSGYKSVFWRYKGVFCRTLFEAGVPKALFEGKCIF